MKNQSVRYLIFLVLTGTLTLGALVRVSAMPNYTYSVHGEAIKDGVGNLSQVGGRSAKTSRGMRIIGRYVPLQGNVRLLAIPVAFESVSDARTTGSGRFPYKLWGPASQPNYLQNRLTALKAYYATVSGNRINLITTLANVVQLDNIMSVYSDDSVSMAEDVIAKADGQIDFSQYDIIMFIHAGAGREMAPDIMTSDIHSHMMPLPDDAALPTNDNVLIGDYVVVPETQCSDAIFRSANGIPFGGLADAFFADYEIRVDGGEINPQTDGSFIPHFWDALGVWAHEVGHCFGLPDVYDVMYTKGLSLDYWSLMGAGSYLPTPDSTESATTVPYTPGREYFGSVPCYPDAYCRKLLGWNAVKVVSTPLLQEPILPAATNGNLYKMWTDGDNTSREYYLLENRAKIGYDKYVPETGLMVYHIDESVGALNLDNIQIDGLHPRIYPLSADNKLEFDIYGAGAFSFAPLTDTAFPGIENVTHLGDTTTPNTNSYTGTNTAVDISNISLLGNTIYADLRTLRPASVTFLSPIAGSTLYVTSPTVHVLAPHIEPTSLTLSLNGNPVTALSYNPTTGDLVIPLTGLGVANFQLVVAGTDQYQGVPISNTLNFSVRSKSIPAGVRMVSFPVTNVGTAPSVLLGQPSPLLAMWEPTTSQAGGIYHFYPDPLTEFTNTFQAAFERNLPSLKYPPAGKGYWSNLSTDTTLQLNGDIVRSDKPFALALNHGFNLIGNPFSVPVSFGSLMVDFNGNSYTMTDAVAQHLIDPYIHSWNGVEYTHSDLQQGVLTPWAGYWIYVRANTNVMPISLVFMPGAAPTTGVASAMQRGVKVPGQWAIDLKAASLTSGYRASATMGVAPGATDHVDAGKDLYAPPAPLAGITLASQNTQGGSLYRDYRAPIDGATYSWNLQVSGPAGSPIVLTWPDLTSVPKGYALNLRDVTAGTERYMRTTSSYALMLGPQETQRTLTLVAEPNRSAGLRIQNIQVSATRANGAVTIKCDITQSASVGLEIRSMTGRLIAVQTAANRGSGTVQLTWDGRDQQGRQLPRGAYQCQITAVTETGQSTKAMTLLRR
ncbi:MAG: FlgD immunoglobulin-like domain containing protein [Armatimonadota bacterium]